MSTICEPRKDKPFMEKKDEPETGDRSEKPRTNKRKEVGSTEDKAPQPKKKAKKEKKDKKDKKNKK
jgi:hypothetical protein